MSHIKYEIKLFIRLGLDPDVGFCLVQYLSIGLIILLDIIKILYLYKRYL